MLHRLHVLFLLLATCGLLAAGCGGDDETPGSKGEAEQECLDQAGRLNDPGARKIAEEACNGNADKARDAAVKQCLDAAKNLPESDQRKKAEDACQAAN
ncbi:MAG: hypothetical protein ACR2ML_03495 [Solirubrobacteraceae bacterium]